MFPSVLVQRFLIEIAVYAGGVSGFDEGVGIGFQNIAYDFRSLESIHYGIQDAFILSHVCAFGVDPGDTVSDVLQYGVYHIVRFLVDDDNGLMGIALMHLVDHEVGHELEDDGIGRSFPAVQKTCCRDQNAVDSEG